MCLPLYAVCTMFTPLVCLCCALVQPTSQINTGGGVTATQKWRKWGVGGGGGVVFWCRGVTEEMVKIERDSMDTMCNGSCSWENTQRKQGTLKPEGWKICRTSRRSDSLPYLIQFYKLSENMLLLSKLWGNALNMCAFILFQLYIFNFNLPI